MRDSWRAGWHPYHHAVALAQSLKVTRGWKLRIDGTVVETTIAHPTHSRLLGDGVRVIGRLLRRSRTTLGEGADLGKQTFRARTRSIRRLTQQLHRAARRKGDQAAEELKQAYARLIGIATASRAQAARVVEALRGQATAQTEHLVERFTHSLPLLERAIDQASRRVLQGESVPSTEKVVSLVEPHTQIIRRHKAGKPAEFGRKVLLDEVEGGIISHFAVLDDVGLEHPHFVANLDAHQQHCGRAPDLVDGDRGVFSPENEARARECGVKRIVLPKTGLPSKERQQHERQRWFRHDFRFRAGGEQLINRCKQFRQLATRYEKRAENYRAMWVVVAILLWR